MNDLVADPDDLLTRVVMQYPAPIGTPDVNDAVVYTDRGYLLLAGAKSETSQRFEKTGVDAVAMLQGSILARTRDDEAAKTYVDDIVAANLDRNSESTPPSGVPDVKCISLTNPSPLDEKPYNCIVRYRRFVVVVNSAQEVDVQQKAAAQYALLANSQ
ncbi:DUF7373 family lipoprotein [Antrihabitans cavernicola]